MADIRHWDNTFHNFTRLTSMPDMTVCICVSFYNIPDEWKKKKVENRSLLSADSNQSRQCTKMVTYVQTNECIAEVKEGRETIHLWRLYEHPDFWGCLEIMVSRLPKVRCFYEYKRWNNIWISKILWVHFQQPHLTVPSALGHILICGKPSYKW